MNKKDLKEKLEQELYLKMSKSNKHTSSNNDMFSQIMDI